MVKYSRKVIYTSFANYFIGKHVVGNINLLLIIIYFSSVYRVLKISLSLFYLTDTIINLKKETNKHTKQ